MTDQINPHKAMYLFPTRKQRLPEPILSQLKTYGLSKLGSVMVVSADELDKIFVPRSRDNITRLLKRQKLSLRPNDVSIVDRIKEVFGDTSNVPVDFLWFPGQVDARAYQECISREIFTCGGFAQKKLATWRDAFGEPIFSSDDVRRLKIRMRVLNVTS